LEPFASLDRKLTSRQLLTLSKSVCPDFACGSPEKSEPKGPKVCKKWERMESKMLSLQSFLGKGVSLGYVVLN
jgi:hypothetical protein